MKELIGKTTAANTYKRHLTSLKLFREFLTATRGVSDIEVKALDAQLMEEYQHYLMTVRSNNNNTTVKYLRNLSKVVNLAKTRGLIQTNPIDLLPLKMQTVEREFLTQDELKRLEEKQIGISRLEQVRDIFLFWLMSMWRLSARKISSRVSGVGSGCEKLETRPIICVTFLYCALHCVFWRNMRNIGLRRVGFSLYRVIRK